MEQLPSVATGKAIEKDKKRRAARCWADISEVTSEEKEDYMVTSDYTSEEGFYDVMRRLEAGLDAHYAVMMEQFGLILTRIDALDRDHFRKEGADEEDDKSTCVGAGEGTSEEGTNDENVDCEVTSDEGTQPPPPGGRAPPRAPLGGAAEPDLFEPPIYDENGAAIGGNMDTSAAERPILPIPRGSAAPAAPRPTGRPTTTVRPTERPTTPRGSVACEGADKLKKNVAMTGFFCIGDGPTMSKKKKRIDKGKLKKEVFELNWNLAFPETASMKDDSMKFCDLFRNELRQLGHVSMVGGEAVTDEDHY